MSLVIPVLCDLVEMPVTRKALESKYAGPVWRFPGGNGAPLWSREGIVAARGARGTEFDTCCLEPDGSVRWVYERARPLAVGADGVVVLSLRKRGLRVARLEWQRGALLSEVPIPFWPDSVSEKCETAVGTIGTDLAAWTPAGRGAIEWSAPLREPTGKTDAVVSGKSVLLRSGSHISRLNRNSGREHWVTALAPLKAIRHEPIAGLAVLGGILVLVAARVTTAVDIRSGRIAWRRPVAGPFGASGPHVIVLSSSGTLSTLDTTDGECVDRIALPSLLGVSVDGLLAGNARLAVTRSLVVVCSADGRMWALRRPRHEVVWRGRVPGEGLLGAKPVVTEGCLYVGSFSLRKVFERQRQPTSLYCFDLQGSSAPVA